MLLRVWLVLGLVVGVNLVSLESGSFGDLTFSILWMSVWSFSLMNAGISDQPSIFFFLEGLTVSFSLIFLSKRKSYSMIVILLANGYVWLTFLVGELEPPLKSGLFLFLISSSRSRMALS